MPRAEREEARDATGIASPWTTHLVTTEDAARLHGGEPRALNDPIRTSTTRTSAAVDALCGVPVNEPGAGQHTASVRCLRIDPSRYEGPEMCVRCIRAYAVMAVRIADEARPS